MAPLNLFLVLLGTLLLYAGGEGLVRNAVRLARTWNLSPLVIGLTVVAFGTSSPELAATLNAATRGAPEIALGNVIGSNIANLGLILGITALVYPIRAQARFIRREVPIMIGVSALLPVLLLNGVVGRLQGLLLLALLVPYLWVLLRSREPIGVEAEFIQEYDRPTGSTWWPLVGTVVGIALLAIGAHSLVEGGVNIARTLGVPERVIGLTLVAFGTSLPELAAALVAALRRETDIVLGNLIGSNIFNVLVVLGATVLIKPLKVAVDGVWIDLGVMLALSLAVVPLLATRYRIGRIEGAALLIAYLLYVGFLYR